MVKVTVLYTGELHCQVIREDPRAILETDAPLDSGGTGVSFSPTDLMASALATCIATTLALYAQRKNWDVTGMRLEVEKSMTTQPIRRIGNIVIKIQIPQDFSLEQKQALERIAASCPVHHSLHPEVKVELIFCWNN
ncbi:OsmC family protein [Neochlamydia sp. S13]|uniref:OsmC family protein n=1 Tax=Neochlamydia sp. S13 TaxID=1353976 RepID=UPI0005A7DDDF|nr:OsmC family protein [Neochlamydia sp. S13]BBI16970.1 OsmC family protein [Neochlamydia sp. S13]